MRQCLQGMYGGQLYHLYNFVQSEGCALTQTGQYLVTFSIAMLERNRRSGIKSRLRR